MVDVGLYNTISTPELLALRAEGCIKFGKFASVGHGWARVEVVTPDRVWWVLVVDPAP